MRQSFKILNDKLELAKATFAIEDLLIANNEIDMLTH